MKTDFSTVNLESIPVELPESAILSRLGRNRFLTRITPAEAVRCKSRMLRAQAAARPRGRWRLVEVLGNDGATVTLSGNWRLASTAFAGFVGDAPLLWLAAVTIGDGVAGLVRAAGQDLGSAVVFDAAGSEIADGAMDVLQQHAARELGRRGLYLDKHRFSAGYGGLALEVQKEIFRRLALETMGMSLSESCIMRPEKSVTAFAPVRRMPI